MRAAIFQGPKDITVGERPDPVIEEPTDAVVRVVLACVCGSDLWYYRGESEHAIGSIGHEFIGVVEDVGADVAGVAQRRHRRRCRPGVRRHRGSRSRRPPPSPVLARPSASSGCRTARCRSTRRSSATSRGVADLRLARIYIPELLDDVLDGTIEPGVVLDLETDLNGTPEAYAAMDESMGHQVVDPGRSRLSSDVCRRHRRRRNRSASAIAQPSRSSPRERRRASTICVRSASNADGRGRGHARRRVRREHHDRRRVLAASVHALVDTATAFGDLTGVIHAAGVSPSQASSATILAVDLYGTALVLEELGKVIAGGGAGVVIASQSGHRHRPPPRAEQPGRLRRPRRPRKCELLQLPIARARPRDGPAPRLPAGQTRQLPASVMAEAVRWGKRGARINTISPGIIFTPLARDELAGPGGRATAG